MPKRVKLKEEEISFVILAGIASTAVDFSNEITYNIFELVQRGD